MKVTKHQNTSVLPILQSGQGFVWTPEGLKAEELATWEDVPEDIKQLAKDINKREYEEHRRNNDVRFTGEKALEPEDWKFAAALAGGIGTAQAASTMGWVPAITTDVASGIGGTAAGYGSNWIGQKIDNKFGTNVTPWLTVVGSLLGGVGGGIAGYKGAVKGAKYAVDNGIRGYSDFKPEIQEQILPIPQATQEPLLNVGWAPKQTIDVRRAGDLTEMYYPGRWDVVEEGANPFGVWLQGKFGIPRTDITNPGKGAKAKRARELFAERPQYKGQITLDKPIQTVGEVPNRSTLSYDAERMGADGIIYNNVYDNGYNNNQVIFSFKRPELNSGSFKLRDAEWYMRTRDGKSPLEDLPEYLEYQRTGNTRLLDKTYNGELIVSPKEGLLRRVNTLADRQKFIKEHPVSNYTGPTDAPMTINDALNKAGVFRSKYQHQLDDAINDIQYNSSLPDGVLGHTEGSSLGYRFRNLPYRRQADIKVAHSEDSNSVLDALTDLHELHHATGNSDDGYIYNYLKENGIVDWDNVAPYYKDSDRGEIGAHLSELPDYLGFTKEPGKRYQTAYGKRTITEDDVKNYMRFSRENGFRQDHTIWGNIKNMKMFLDFMNKHKFAVAPIIGGAMLHNSNDKNKNSSPKFQQGGTLPYYLKYFNYGAK